MKIVAIQMPVTADKARNIEMMRERVRRAAREGAHLIVLPEMWNCPYTNDCFAAYAEPAEGDAWCALRDMAREAGVYVVGGSIPERDGECVYNTSFVFAPDGSQLARHRKMHLFDIDVVGGQRFFESETFTAGREVTTFDTPYGVFGLCICFDLRFPELARCMALRGARAIVTPAAFNMTTGPAHWELMFRQRAVDNQLFTVGAAPARDEGGVYVSYANSIVCSPWGTVLARAGAGDEVLLCDVDLEENERVRAQLPLLSARRTDVYELREIKTI